MYHRRYDPSLLYLVTLRTIDGRWTLNSQDVDFQRQIVGAIAAAQAATKVRVYAFTFMSNHYHGLFAADDPEQFAAFLCLLHAATARLVNQAYGRRGPMWHPRAHVAAVLPGEASEINALCYVLLQAVRAGLVDDPRDWTGASSARWLLDGVLPSGERVNQTARTLAGRNSKDPGPVAQYTEQLKVAMSPLPHLAHLGEAGQREVLRGIVAAVLGRSSESVPENARHCDDESVTPQPECASVVDAAPRPSWLELPQSPQPRSKGPCLCIAPSEAAEREYRDVIKAFEAAYAEASARLRIAAAAAARGEVAAFVAFPQYSFAAAGRIHLRRGESQ